MLKEAKRLHDLGFGVLWLRPKSKAPIDSKWTSGPRKTWAELEKQYQPEMNMGVRLGSASQINGKYLAVLDIDVKSENLVHQSEALGAVKKLFPELGENYIHVLSGRGNGSMHIYFLTHEPLSPRLLARSEHRVKVFMPSAVVNAKQKGLLTEIELKEGYRMRPAWEVSGMGEGQQVVLPPSTHPDTGLEYLWGLAIANASDLTVLNIEGKKIQEKRQTTSTWQPEDVYDLVQQKLDASTYTLLVNGDCEDRSAALFRVAISLVKEGLTDFEIMSALTDEVSYALAAAPFEHAKTSSRERAANWVYNYTIKKARKEADASKDFQDEVETITLTEDEAAAQAEELKRDWRDRIERNSSKGANAGKPKITMMNIILILQNAVGENCIKYDLFGQKEIIGCENPWDRKIGSSIDDTALLVIKEWLARSFRLEAPLGLIQEAVAWVGEQNGFHPVRDYVLSLKWDGKPRIDTWLKDYLKAVGPEPYLSAVSRKILCAMVARVFEPGIKFDNIPIFEGKQGVGKSTAAKILAGDDWFIDHLPDIKHPDARLNMQGKWVIELGELAGFKRTELEQVKAFITSPVDSVRAPYGRKAKTLLRQGIFIGSTNESFYLKDTSGNRRYWPLEVGECNLNGLRKVRNQLFAEAYIQWALCGERLWLEGEPAKQAEEVQSNKTLVSEEEIYTEKLLEFFEAENSKPENERFNPIGFKIKDLFSDFGPFADTKVNSGTYGYVSKVLVRLGFIKYRVKGLYKWRPSMDAKAFFSTSNNHQDQNARLN